MTCTFDVEDGGGVPRTTGPDSSDTATRIRLAVIGAATMGSTMASRLLSSQLDVTARGLVPEDPGETGH